MNTCYICTRRKNHFGFNLLKGFVFGTFDGTEYVTNGNIKGGKMLIYTHNGNGWIYSSVDAYKNAIAQMVTARYGKIIAEKNSRYKGSEKEIHDRQKEYNKPHGKHLELRVAKPFGGTAPNAENYIRRVSRRERTVGL